MLLIAAAAVSGVAAFGVVVWLYNVDLLDLEPDELPGPVRVLFGFGVRFWLIWNPIFVCYSTVWLPAMQLYTLLARPQTEPVDSSWWMNITAVIPYTLIWTALFTLLACLVLFDPMFRAIFRTFIREWV